MSTYHTEYDSDPEPDTPQLGGSRPRASTSVPRCGQNAEQKTALGYTPAQSKLWADYLCNADTPFSYSSTVHHPEHFNFVPRPPRQQPIASQYGAAAARLGANAAAIAAAKAMAQPKKNKRSSITAGLDCGAGPAAAEVIPGWPSPLTVVGARKSLNRVPKRQRRVCVQGSGNVDATVFPVVHYPSQNPQPQDAMEIDDN